MLHNKTHRAKIAPIILEIYLKGVRPLYNILAVTLFKNRLTSAIETQSIPEPILMFCLSFFIH